MFVNIDTNKCVGCGRCTEICPDAFKLNEITGKAEIINSSREDCIKKASDQCPIEAIYVEE